MALKPISRGEIFDQFNIHHHFDILASGKTDYLCTVKETLLIQELQVASNVNVEDQ